MPDNDKIVDLKSGGVARSKLPQIPDEIKTEFVRWLQTQSYPETRNPNPQGENPNAEKGGNYYNVGLVSDVAVIAAKTPVKFLKPIQKQLNKEKVKDMLKDIDNLRRTVFIVAKDNELFDGHHRWAALMVWNKHFPVKVLRAQLPVEELILRAKEFSGSFSRNMFENIKMVDLLQEVFAKRGINA